MNDTYNINIPQNTHLALYSNTEVLPFYEYSPDNVEPENREGTEKGWSVFLHPRNGDQSLATALCVADLPTEISANELAWAMDTVLFDIQSAT